MLGSVANHQAGLCAKMPKKMAEDVVKKLQVPPLLSCAAVLLCSAALSLWLCRARVHAGGCSRCKLLAVLPRSAVCWGPSPHASAMAEILTRIVETVPARARLAESS